MMISACRLRIREYMCTMSIDTSLSFIKDKSV